MEISNLLYSFDVYTVQYNLVINSIFLYLKNKGGLKHNNIIYTLKLFETHYLNWHYSK